MRRSCRFPELLTSGRGVRGGRRSGVALTKPVDRLEPSSRMAILQGFSAVTAGLQSATSSLRAVK